MRSRHARSLAALLWAVVSVLGALSLADSATGVAPVAQTFTELTGSAVNQNGTYTPVVGNFAGDARDDIFWYGFGDTSESLWIGSNSTTKPFTVSSTRQVTGTQQAVVGDFGGDQHDDILWYGPGDAGDALWISNGTSFTTRSVKVAGNYRPVVVPRTSGLSSDRDAVVWEPLVPSKSISVWQFRTDGSHTAAMRGFLGYGASRTMPVPVVGRFGFIAESESAAIIWYGPGSDRDAAWSLWTEEFTAGLSIRDRQLPSAMIGQHIPVVGNFVYPKCMDSSCSASTFDDVLWMSHAGLDSLWWKSTTPPPTGDWQIRGVDVPAGKPVAINVGLGRPDVLLIVTPTGDDLIQSFDPEVGEHLVPTGNANIASVCQLVVGNFHDPNTTDVLCYRPGSGEERLLMLP